MQYKIIRTFDDLRYSCVNKLEEEVQEHLNKGWKPQGGVSIAIEKHGYEVTYTACQALVKE